MLVWNRAKPSDGSELTVWHNEQATEFPPAVSNYRRELSIAISEDDGRTWTEPIVMARQLEGGQFSYPYVFERRPGEIWITVGFTWLGKWNGPKGEPLRLQIVEKELQSICAP